MCTPSGMFAMASCIAHEPSMLGKMVKYASRVYVRSNEMRINATFITSPHQCKSGIGKYWLPNGPKTNLLALVWTRTGGLKVSKMET
jgi:hypothetical protein